jgi:hypothetical protein
MLRRASSVIFLRDFIRRSIDDREAINRVPVGTQLPLNYPKTNSVFSVRSARANSACKCTYGDVNVRDARRSYLFYGDRPAGRKRARDWLA